MKVLELDPHLHAQRGIEVRERLVHQERPRRAQQGTPERDPLSLTARELGRSAVEQRLDVQEACDLLHARAHLRARLAPHLHAEGQVLVDGHVRVERVALEDHREVAILRRHAVLDLATDRDRPVGGPLEAGEHAQRGRLATAGRPDEDEELAILDVEREVVDRDDLAEQLVDVIEADRRHQITA